ncbi:peptide chain release factor [Chishuiella changwenlii]|uniref:Peptide chain release factor n=1 Tax=Chishuiella changwenlii TaxID=1434701 RepID=A0A1M7B337_9FLAO|nr:peptide chain release factor H [Chishuiella changwenlii]GGE95720.1 peptide chain release factor H [Chishuiella changwenlii]SHL49393.1 peptide chain release factor [Chishuiella changwenlii]
MIKIIQITSGRGPAECNFVVTNVFKRFTEACEINNIEYAVIEREIDKDFNLVCSVTLELKGKQLDVFIKEWLGTILWIGKSPFRKFHQRKNWFIGCFELELPKENKINSKEIVYQTMRSSGNGGQNVNKVNSAVRATHLPSGISVVSMDSRSQHQNKKIATTRLLLKLQDDNDQKLKNSIQERWINQTSVERGNPIKIYKGDKFL